MKDIWILFTPIVIVFPIHYLIVFVKSRTKKKEINEDWPLFV